ncbi:MAG: archease, partial [Candidatus Omnitrophica bacterium]|nr:archease [Candidatus Omnitrophota bacterium]
AAHLFLIQFRRSTVLRISQSVTRKSYQLIEHTADIGIKVQAKTRKELFQKTAAAMFDLIAEKKPSALQKLHAIRITQHAESLDELLVYLLNELLSLSATKELIFTRFGFSKLTDTSLSVRAIGVRNSAFRIITEIKAATFHELSVKKIKRGWQAQVIFDV